MENAFQETQLMMNADLLFLFFSYFKQCLVSLTYHHDTSAIIWLLIIEKEHKGGQGL